MAAINEAYRVLGDPGRRALYDAAQRGAAAVPTPPAGAGHGRAAGRDEDDDADFVPMAPWQRRLPLWSILVLGSLFTVFLFTAYASSGRGTGTTTTLPAVDGTLAIGSCVQEVTGGLVEEIGCGGRRSGVVMALIVVGDRCPPGTDGLRRADGVAGYACISRT